MEKRGFSIKLFLILSIIFIFVLIIGILLFYVLSGNGISGNAIGLSPGTSLFFQAESGQLTNFIVTPSFIYQNFSSNDINSNNGIATYNFVINQSGNYIITGYVSAPDAGSNSLFVNIDVNPDNTMIWDVIPYPTNGFVLRNVTWRGGGYPDFPEFNPKVFNLNQGNHQLIIIGRELNTSLDYFNIILLNSSNISQNPVCGNSALESGEQCDDGNVVSGDGCSATCLSENQQNNTLYTCFDNDYGIDYFNLGNISNGTLSKLDFCTGNVLSEHYCSYDEKTILVSNFTCDTGCNSGKCNPIIESNVSVNDSLSVIQCSTSADCPSPSSNKYCSEGSACNYANTYVCSDSVCVVSSIGSCTPCGSGCDEGYCLTNQQGNCENSCSYNGRCVPIGGKEIFDGVESYCGEDFSFTSVKGTESVCVNNYECSSGSCTNGKCASIVGDVKKIGFFKKFWCAIINNPLFGGSQAKYKICINS